MAKRRHCDELRDGKTCDGRIYQCVECGEQGCRKPGCRGQNFQAPQTCMHCGQSYRMKDVFDSASPPPVSSSVPGSRTRPFGTEMIFGALALLFVLGVIVASFASRSLGPRTTRVEAPVVRTEAQQHADAVLTDVCQCFREGRRLAAQDVSVLSSEYATGFTLCREIHGVLGGAAWTAGWNAVVSPQRGYTNCRAWRRGTTIRIDPVPPGRP